MRLESRDGVVFETKEDKIAYHMKRLREMDRKVSDKAYDQVEYGDSSKRNGGWFVRLLMVGIVISGLYLGYRSGWVDEFFDEDEVVIEIIGDDNREVEEGWGFVAEWQDADGVRFDFQVLTEAGWEFNQEKAQEAMENLCEGGFGVDRVRVEIGADVEPEVSRPTTVFSTGQTSEPYIRVMLPAEMLTDYDRAKSVYEKYWANGETLPDSVEEAVAWLIVSDVVKINGLFGADCEMSSDDLDFVRSRDRD